jgi:ammonium transporter, Amt family
MGRADSALVKFGRLTSITPVTTSRRTLHASNHRTHAVGTSAVVTTGVVMTIDGGATAWVLISTALVLFMTPGLAFFYGGMVRAKHVLGMIMQNFFAIGLMSVLWALVGFSFAFGGNGRFFGDFSFVGLKGLANMTKDVVPGYTGSLALTIPPLLFVAFQMMFAVITPALITGATADRLKFSAYSVFIGLWLLLVYAPVAHWVFSPNGWLFKLGALDFAGGAVVHINAGIAALVVVKVVGNRRGWRKEPMPPHSLPFTLLGTGILWFGWFGFNAGSALGSNGLAAQAFMNTHLAASAAMCTWLLVEKLKGGHATTLGAASGAVAGLVAITPCAGFVNSMSALAIGALAGAVCYLALAIKNKLNLDDALDVIGVHLIGGILGSLLLGIFASKSINAGGFDGLFAGGGFGLLGKQALATVVVLVFSGAMSFVIAKVIDKTMGMRITDDQETQGMDLSLHSETAYSFAGRS